MSFKISEVLLICTACGTQFDIPANTPLKACRICDDSRQFVPSTDQTWTSLATLHSSKKYSNTITQDPIDPRIFSITTEPKFGIGQRCILLETVAGNVLWDCIAYLDEEIVRFIEEKGGLKAIVISHPHYYTTHLDWARTFGCPVYLAREDEEWLSRVNGERGGSLLKSGLYHVNRPPGTNSYVFMWSIPNMIPLRPSESMKMWKALRPLEFESTHGAFTGTKVRDKNVKARVLESMKIQARAEGWEDVEILKESLQ